MPENNPYLSFLESRQDDPVSTTPPGAENPYLSALEQQEQAGEIRKRATVGMAVTTNPELEAQTRNLAKALGVEPAVVQGLGLDEAKRQDALRKVQESTKQAPALSRAYTREDFARLAHDDSDNLSVLERVLTEIGGRGIMRGAAQDKATDLGFRKATGQKLTTQEEISLQDAQAKMSRLAAGQEGRGLLSYLLNTTTYTGTQLVMGLPFALAGAAPTAAAGAATGAAGAAIAGQMGPQAVTPEEVVTVPAAAVGGAMWGGRTGFVAGQGFYNYRTETGMAYLEYSAFRDETGQPIDNEIATGAAHLTGVLNMGLETVADLTLAKLSFPGLDKLLSAPAKDTVSKLLADEAGRGLLKRLGQRVGTAATVEGFTEAVQETVNILVGEGTKVVAGGDFETITPEQAAERVTSAAIEGAVGGGGVATVTAPLQLAIENREIKRRELEGRVSEREIGRVEAAIEAASNSKLAQRDRDELQRFIDDAAAESPVSTVYITPDSLAQTAQDLGLDVRAVATQLGVSDQLQDAALTGSDIQISVGKFISTVAGTDLAAPMLEIIKTDPFLYSRTEIKQLQEAGNDDVIARAEQLVNSVLTDREFRASADTVRTQVAEQLRATMRWTDDVNNVYASATAQGYLTLAQRLGITPEEAFARVPLTIMGASITGQMPGALQQLPSTIDVNGVQTPTINSAGQQIAQNEEGVRNFAAWFGDSKVTDEQGRPMVVYHGGLEAFGEGANTITRANRYRPFWVTPDQNYARGYGPRRGGQIAALYTNIKNPANLTAMAQELLPIYNADQEMLDLNADALWTEEDGNIAEQAFVLAHSPRVMDYLASQGYDAVIVEELPGIWSYGILDPNQIKSTANVGTFDPATPNILAQAQAEGYAGQDTGEAQEWVRARAKGLDMSQAARMERARAMGFDTETVLYHGTTYAFDEFTGLTFLTEDPREGSAYGNLGSRERAHLDAAETAARTRIFDPGDIEGQSLPYTGIFSDVPPNKRTQLWATDEGIGTWIDDKLHVARGYTVEYGTPAPEGYGYITARKLRPNEQDPAEQYFKERVDYAREKIPTNIGPTNVVLPLYARRGKYKQIDNPFEANILGKRLQVDLDKTQRARLEQLLADVEQWKQEGYIGIDTMSDEGAMMGVPIRQKIIFNPSDIRSVNAAFDPDFSESANILAQEQIARPQSSVQPDGDSPMRVSTRQPWSVKSQENALTDNLLVGLASTLADPKFADKVAGTVRGYVNFPAVEGETTEQTLERYIQHVVDNLLWLHDSYDAETRDRADQWYDGARAISDAWMARYNLPDYVIAGVIAALSPQKDWFQNVSMAERVLDVYETQRETAWTPEMQATADRIFPRIKLDPKTGEPVVNKKGDIQGYEEIRNAIDGKTIADLEAEFGEDADGFVAAWIRIYDQTFNEPGFRVLTPEGRFADYVVNQDGVTRSRVQWGSLTEIGKAVSMIRNPNRDAVSEALGQQHKVRNFYNNILAPNAPYGDVTIDTHAVAAAHIRPHSAASPEVDQNLNGPPASAATGTIGTYGIHAEAYRRAAEQRGILPRQMQSITWEAVRTLFKPRFKTKANAAKIDAIWKEHRDGTITAEEARNRISELAGGIEPPAWVGTRSDSGDDAASGYSTYEGEVPRSRVPGGPAGRVGRGARGATTAGDTEAFGQETLAQTRRGEYVPSLNEIRLNPQADLSTYLHELGHHFLEMYNTISLKLVAKQTAGETLTDQEQLLVDDTRRLIAEIARQTNTVIALDTLAWWNSLAFEQRVPMHEQFARLTEAYFLEGRAPTPELQGMFQTIKRWMMAVYRSLKELNVELSPEVTQVMDRMWAASADIATAERNRGLNRMFSVKPEFMTDQEWEAYQQIAAQATTDAEEELTARSLRDMQWLSNARSRELRKLQKAASEKRKTVEAEVTAEVMELPVNRARTFLKRGLNTAGEAVTGPHKLSIPQLKERFPEGSGVNWQALGYGQYGMLANEGLDPDTAAELLGYPSGEALLQSLLSAEPAETVIEAETDRRMLERYGDLSDDAAMGKAADEAIHNGLRSRVLQAEYAALAKAANRSKALVASAKQIAQQQVGKLNAAKLNANKFLAAERAAGRKAEAALRKNDLVGAATAKRDQLLNFEIAREVQRVLKQRDRALDLFTRIVTAKRDTVSKTRNYDLVQAARAILSAYGMGRVQNEAMSYMDAIRAYDPVLYSALEPTIINALANRATLDQLTVDQLLGLRDVVKQLWDLSRAEKVVEIDGKKIELADITAELNLQLETMGAEYKGPSAEAPTEWQKRLRQFAGLKASMRRVESWARMFDGGKVGPFTRYVWRTVSTAADRYRADRNKYVLQFRELFRAIEPTMGGGKINASEINYTFANKAELLHAILHTGNSSNYRKLLLGRGWGELDAGGVLIDNAWNNMIQRLAREGVLTKADFDFAQGVWDLLEETKPLAQEAHRKVFGRYFSEITAETVQTPFGTYRGGYVPAVYDTYNVQDAALRAQQDAVEANDSTMFPSPASGFTKSRVEYNRELALDLMLLPQHIDKVLKFAYLASPVRDVLRILRDKGFSSMLESVDPTAQSDMLLPWLQRASRQIVEEPTKGQGGPMVDGFFRAIRQRSGMGLMFANLVNVAQQVTGFSLAAITVKPKYLAAGFVRYIRNPKALTDTVRQASPMMRDRGDNQLAAMYGEIDKIIDKDDKYGQVRDWFGRHTYFMQQGVQNVMDVIVWLGAYDQALAAGETEAEAAKQGDAAVRQTQSSTLPEDISRVESGPAVLRSFTHMYSYFNMWGNLLSTEFRTTLRELGLKKGAGRLMYAYIAGFAIPAMLAQVIADGLRGQLPEDEDDDGWLDEWLSWFFMTNSKTMLAFAPIVGQAGNATIGAFTAVPYDDRVGGSPAISTIEASVRTPASVYEAVVEDGDKSRAVKDTLTLLTTLTGLPFQVLGRSVGYAVDVAEGDISPTSEADYIRGLVTGAASASSR